MNKCIIIGNVGKEPEVRSFQNGGRVANISVATSETWTDKSSAERKERTTWHKIVVTNDALINVVEKYVRKGTKLAIEGQIETRKYMDANAAERYVTEIVIRPYKGELTILSPKETAGDAAPVAAKGNSDNLLGLDDEIPF